MLPLDAQMRPLLQRNQQPTPPPAVPPPPTQSAPLPPGSLNAESAQPPDSLSLAQLRRFVADFPRTEPIAYDYAYEDLGPIAEEIDEWFTYNFFQWVRLNSAHRDYRSLGQEVLGGEDMQDVDPLEMLVRAALRRITLDDDAALRHEAIGALVYVVLGQWAETAVSAILPAGLNGKAKSVATRGQLDAMRDAALLVAECGGIPVIWEAMRTAFEPFWYVPTMAACSLRSWMVLTRRRRDEIQGASPQQLQSLVEDLLNPMTIMYMLVQEALEHPVALAPVRAKLRKLPIPIPYPLLICIFPRLRDTYISPVALQPDLVHFMLHATVKLRWDETGTIPQTQVRDRMWFTNAA